ncbi:MAG TPA: hypothetical protein VEB65_13895 [Solirubrobacterales bacterium]|nr:hypothetical protein [Solirubrobacterales bacterium]
MPLEELRIVHEAAECSRARPESDAALRRRNMWIKSASAHHSLYEVAEAAGLPPQEVDSMLQGTGNEPEPEPRRAATGLRTWFRSTTA